MTDVQGLYRRFAEVEARGMSPMYEEWALGVADDPELCALIAALPSPKRQVNLVFSAARWHGVPLGPWPRAKEWMLTHWARLVPTILDRATQTNEAGRCATLMPALSSIAGPLALLEVGASAGLCLYPDRYSYRFTVGDDEFGLDPPGGASPVVLPCELIDADPPLRVPEVAWRAGIDLNPLDITDRDDAAWLEALVWPEHDDRRERLVAASALAAADPARIVAGDLLQRLPDLAAEAPPESTLVIFHSAVLMYLSPDDRARFVALVDEIARTRATVWLANEAADVVPGVAGLLPTGLDTRGAFALSFDGSPIALTQPHGRWYRAL